MTIIGLASGARLDLPEEPSDLKAALRDALLGGSDWRKGFSDDVCIGVWLWARWQPALEPAGITREAFVDVVVDARLDLWQWLMGDRPWDRYLAGLADRIADRIADRMPPRPVTG